MPLSAKEMLRLFLNEGWILDRQKGSHMMMEKDGRHAVIPNHKD
jgi:predicted RNA binding protein YcfA (HicA-like mRNA interferase family)